jgi:hypothetical protein
LGPFALPSAGTIQICAVCADAHAHLALDLAWVYEGGHERPTDVHVRCGQGIANILSS